MLPCHSRYIDGTWRSKEEGRGFKVWGEPHTKSKREVQFLLPIYCQNYLPISAACSFKNSCMICTT